MFAPQVWALLGLAGLTGLTLAAPGKGSSSGSPHKRYVEERGGITYNVFKKREDAATSLSYVENSGICVSQPCPTNDPMHMDFSVEGSSC